MNSIETQGKGKNSMKKMKNELQTHLKLRTTQNKARFSNRE